MELNWRQMERDFQGEVPKGRIEFMTGTHVEKNLELQKNVKTKMVYYALRFPDMNDWVAKPAPKELIEAHPKEFAHYLAQIEKGNIEPYAGYGEEDTDHCAIPFEARR